MNVNPEDYDPEELRQMAEERRTTGQTNGRSRPADDLSASRGSQNGGSEGRGFEYDTGYAEDESADRQRTRSRRRAGREPARGSRGNPGGGRGVAADALRSNQLEQLFLHQSAMTAEGMSKPYLAGVPQKYAAERVIFDWLEFLVLKGGFKRTMDALRYYRTIDWITDDVESALQDYLIGFSQEGVGTQELDVDDHQLSLVYVARLASMS